mgnify:FL=1
MSDTRQPPSDDHGRQPGTASGAVLPQATAAADTTRRHQPPLQEVLKGLDAREMESSSIFDQLFGPLAEGDPRLPGRDAKR